MVMKYSEIRELQKDCRSIGELKRKILDQTLLNKNTVPSKEEREKAAQLKMKAAEKAAAKKKAADAKKAPEKESKE